MIFVLLAALAAVPVACELSGGYPIVTLENYVCIHPDDKALTK